MRKLFSSSLFLRVFSTTTAVLMGLFVSMYLLSVPFIQNTVEHVEEDHAQTVLDNVYDAVEKIYRDIENTRTKVILARKLALRDIIAVVESRALGLEQQVSQGRLTMVQAKRMLLDEIRGIHYGNNDYVWAADYRSVLVAHPDPKLNGADFSSQQDARGNLIVPPMVTIARASGDGYYSYWWRRLGQEQQIEKLSYAKHLPFFELVIGTGVYIDDIEANLVLHREAAISELRLQLRNIRLAKTGYVYIFDSQQRVIIHPNANLEGGSLSGMIDPVSKQELSPMLMAAAGKPEGVRYKWDSPNDSGNYAYDKISWVRYFPDFDWYIGSSVYVTELTNSATTLGNRMLAVFAATLILSIVLVYWFVSRLVAPLKKLSDTALAIEQGNLDVRCPIQRDDEIGIVAAAVNVMVDRLRDNIQNLDAKVSSRTVELEKANQDLRQLDQLKSDFLSTVSHELRTPMTSIIGFAKLVRKKLDEAIFPKVTGDDKTVRAMAQVTGNIDIIIRESERLTLLISDVLDSAKLDAGKMEWQFSPLSPNSLLERAAATTAPLAAQKGLALSWRDNLDLPEIMGDKNRLLQVLINLISNAVKFTEQGQIRLSAVQVDGFVRFSVQDTGVGIAPENHAHIFDKFRQIGDTLTDKPQGTGLGLSICHQIVKHHGGDIGLESASGIGSTFYFTVPVASA